MVQRDCHSYFRCRMGLAYGTKHIGSVVEHIQTEVIMQETEFTVEYLNAKDIREINASLKEINGKLGSFVTKDDLTKIENRLENLETVIGKAMDIRDFLKSHWKAIFIFFTVIGGFLAFEIMQHFPFWVSVLKTLK